MPYHRLVEDLNPGTLRELSQHLNPDAVATENWRSLANHLGFTNRNILNFARVQVQDPTFSVLQEWWSGKGVKTVTILLDILKKMNRFDCVRLLEAYEFTGKKFEYLLYL